MPCASGYPARDLNEERTCVDEDEEVRGGSAVLAVGRPLQSLLMATGVLAVAAAYVLLPGLAAVFGLAPAAFLITQYLWGTGLLAAPEMPKEALHVRSS